MRDHLGCCTDVSKMFQRLDIKYGDPCKIMECIVSQIHRFKGLDKDDPIKIIQFVDLLEKDFRDLKSLGLEGEIANANTVSLIENKLPRSIHMEWYREIYKEASTVNRSAKFSHLLKFLTTERNVLEYATSELRKDAKISSSNIYTAPSVSDDSCVIHFWPNNHSTSNCRTYMNLTMENKYKVLNENSACYGCLRVGHGVSHSPTKTFCGEGCNKYHHPSLHNSEQASGLSNTIFDSSLGNYNSVLLPVMKPVPASKSFKALSCLWDAGADISFLTNCKAKRLKLQGKPVTLYVTTAGGQKVQSSR